MTTNSNSLNDLPKNSTGQIGPRLMRFGLGFGLWALAIAFFSFGVSTTQGEASGFLAVIILLPMIGVFALSMKGCQWLSGYKLGTIGNFLKFMAFLLMMMTVVGMLPIAYWTGKAVLQWFADRS